jgi:hypothetical protein
MLIIEIKQAETALADGRLDEAFDLLQSAEVRSHRRGQELIGQLSRALVDRAKQHYAAGRLPQTMADCEKASRLAGNQPDVAELRAIVARALVAKQSDQQQRAQRFAAAKARIEQGQLSMGAGLLEGAAADDEQARGLREDLEIRRSTAESLLGKAAAALASDDWEGAIGQLAQARSLHATDSRVTELLNRISRLVGEKLREAMTAGRLDLAELLLQRLRRLGERTLEVDQAERVLQQCRQAWEYVDRSQPRLAEQVLRRLTTVLPDAKWLDRALENVAHVGEAIEQVRGGPLGFMAERTGGGAAPVVSQPRRAENVVIAGASEAPRAAGEAVAVRFAAPAAATTPPGAPLSRFLLQVDGAGSYCVFHSAQVTVGPVSSSPVADLGLIGDPGMPTVAIQRSEDDYFLRTAKPIAVNQRTCTSKLLAAGDRIALSPRCHVTFMVPNPASTSAVLDFSGARFPRGDVRRAILLDRELIIGPGPAAHVRVDQMTEPVVLHIRDGRLWCQAKAEVTINGQTAGFQAELPLGSHVRVASLSFAVTEG